MLTRDIYKSFSKWECLVAAFLDIKGAYDHVSWQVFQEILHDVGLRPIFANVIMNIIQHYYYYRTYKDRYGDIFEGPKNSSQGVPQGSTLSSLLYGIYTSSLETVITSKCKILKYIMMFLAPTLATAINSLSHSLNKVSLWLTLRNSEISSGKFSAVIFTRRNIPEIVPNKVIN